MAARVMYLMVPVMLRAADIKVPIIWQTPAGRLPLVVPAKTAVELVG